MVVALWNKAHRVWHSNSNGISPFIVLPSFGFLIGKVMHLIGIWGGWEMIYLGELGCSLELDGSSSLALAHRKPHRVYSDLPEFSRHPAKSFP